MKIVKVQLGWFYGAMGLLAFGAGAIESAHADWQANFSTQTLGEKKVLGSGTIQARAGKQRFDVSEPMALSFLVEPKKATALAHPMRAALDVPVEKVPFNLPACPGADAKVCLTQEGFKKRGAESIDGKKTTLFEKETTYRKESVTIRVWQPDEMAEVIAVRIHLVRPKGKKPVETNLTDIKMGPIAATQFEIPADYSSKGPLQDFAKKALGL